VLARLLLLPGTVDALFRMLLVEGIGVCLLLLLGNSFRWWSLFAAAQTMPIREKLLRSPGESLRRNLEQLNEYLIYSVVLFLVAPMLFAWQAPVLTNLWALAFLLGLMALCALPGIWVIRLYRLYALGLRGERAVGEELNLLMHDGCHVFHDYPAAPNWHVDHIVIAPSGVYAIETSTRRKGRSSGQCPHEVIFDGKVLHFSGTTSAEPVEQARRSAEAVRHELSTELAEELEVKAILTLPGWSIRRQGRGDVRVLTPKEIWPLVVTTAPSELTPAQVQRIAYHFQQKCRDVEI